MVILILSIISMLTTFIGLWFVSEKNKLGFIYYTISLLCQLYLFLFTELKSLPLAAQMVVLIASNFYVYLKWRKDDVVSNN